MHISVHIEQLILEGLPVTRSQGSLVQAAVEAELARLLAAHGLAASLQMGGALPSLRVEAVQLQAGSVPAQIGQQIAQSVYGGLGHTQKVNQ